MSMAALSVDNLLQGCVKSIYIAGACNHCRCPGLQWAIDTNPRWRNSHMTATTRYSTRTRSVCSAVLHRQQNHRLPARLGTPRRCALVLRRLLMSGGMRNLETCPQGDDKRRLTQLPGVQSRMLIDCLVRAMSGISRASNASEGCGSYRLCRTCPHKDGAMLMM
jgi:hypothetical protein